MRWWRDVSWLEDDFIPWLLGGFVYRSGSVVCTDSVLMTVTAGDTTTMQVTAADTGLMDVTAHDSTL